LPCPDAHAAAPRRTAIDGEIALLHATLMAWQRRRAAGLRHDSAAKPERRGPPSDFARARGAAGGNAFGHTNRIRGLLFGQGITNYNPPE